MIETTVDYSNVRNTPWAKQELDAWTSVSDAIPKAMQTGFDMWQRRVGDPSKARCSFPMRRVYPITALRYETKDDGTFGPIKPCREFTFLVCADTQRQATERVLNDLENHGYSRNEWCLTISTACPLILVA